jgi:hypothetical protein
MRRATLADRMWAARHFRDEAKKWREKAEVCRLNATGMLPAPAAEFVKIAERHDTHAARAERVAALLANWIRVSDA